MWRLTIVSCRALDSFLLLLIGSFFRLCGNNKLVNHVFLVDSKGLASKVGAQNEAEATQETTTMMPAVRKKETTFTGITLNVSHPGRGRLFISHTTEVSFVRFPLSPLLSRASLSSSLSAPPPPPPACGGCGRELLLAAPPPPTEEASAAEDGKVVFLGTEPGEWPGVWLTLALPPRLPRPPPPPALRKLRPRRLRPGLGRGLLLRGDT